MRTLTSRASRRSAHRLPLALTAAVASSLAIGGAGTTVAAQTITPRTMPVSMAQQFDILPSDRAGMGGISIAIDDTLLDPFVNPAKALRVGSGFFSISPYFHGVSDDKGGGKTFPVSGVVSFGEWAAGGLFALQQLDRTRRIQGGLLSDRTAANQYVSGILARRLGQGWSLGTSLSAAQLGAEDGVDLLYSGSDRIVQAGGSSELRLGLTREWGTRKLFEAMLLRGRFDMTHDVHYPTQSVRTGTTVVTTPARDESNRDYTLSSGAHVAYSQPVGTEGWRVGAIGTVNRLSHPKIPDYRVGQVITVPRDPGHTYAWRAGAGATRTMEHVTVGFDVVTEPMFSRTWALAARDTVSRLGTVIPFGTHTIDNRIRFSNAMMNFGWARTYPDSIAGHSSTLQVGLGVYSINYRLRQRNAIADSARVQVEHWMEWTPTLSWRVTRPTHEFRYSFSVTCSAGASCGPTLSLGHGDDVTATPPTPAPGGGVIAAPTAALKMSGSRVLTHRFTWTFRIR